MNNDLQTLTFLSWMSSNRDKISGLTGLEIYEMYFKLKGML